MSPIDQAIATLVAADRQLGLDLLHAVDVCARANFHVVSLDGTDVAHRELAQRLERVRALLEANLG